MRTKGSPYLVERHEMVRSIREFFELNRFIEVDTPSLVTSPGMDLHLDAFEVLSDNGRRWLNTSPEYQMKRLLVEGHPRIYQMTHSFRAGEKGELHQPEFTMLEWYRTNAGSKEVMQDTERLVCHVVESLGAGSTSIPARGKPVDISPPWERLTVAQAFQTYARRDMWELVEDEEQFYRVLIESVEPNLGQGKPTFLTHYPASMASLARLDPDDPTVADRFEAYIDGVELCNGFGELTDPEEQRQRFESDQIQRREQGKAIYPIDERFIGALQQGMPQSGGNALGVDRLIMLILGAASVGEVMAFPSDRI